MNNPPEVIIDGVRYLPENHDHIPDRASIFYMHDNHTFTKLEGDTATILREARRLGKESPYGMLCPVILLHGKKEIRRVGPHIHAQKELGDTAKWESAVFADADAMRLIGARAITKTTTTDPSV